MEERKASAATGILHCVQNDGVVGASVFVWGGVVVGVGVLVWEKRLRGARLSSSEGRFLEGRGGLVDADEVGKGGEGGFGDPVEDGDGVGVGVEAGVDADPEAGGTGELGDAGAGVAAEEGGLEG